MLFPRLLREDARFRRFWLGQSVSLLGDQVSLIALPLVAVLVGPLLILRPRDLPDAASEEAASGERIAG